MTVALTIVANDSEYARMYMSIYGPKSFSVLPAQHYKSP